jgi:hypothetical protein
MATGVIMSKVTGLGGASQPVSNQSVESLNQTNLHRPDEPSQQSSEFQSSGALRIGSRDAGRRINEHRAEGELRQADLNVQLPGGGSSSRAANPDVLRSPIQLEQPQQTDTPEETASPVSAEAAGLSGTHEPLPNEQLQDYFNSRAPQHSLIASGRYGEAARNYRRLAEQASRQGDINLTSTNLNIANQLDFTDRMQRAGVRNLSFPPSDRNVDDYFSSLRRESASRVARDYQDYTRAFFVHHGSSRPLQYDSETHRIRGTHFETHIPEDWNDVTSSRQMRNGQRMIDCEGYAYLGQRLLSRAGFGEGRFTAIGSPDDSRTERDESQLGHIMWSGTRRRVAGDPETFNGFAIAISNDDATLIPTSSSRTSNEAREAALLHVYRQLPNVRYRGEASTAWQAEYNAVTDLERREQTESPQ